MYTILFNLQVTKSVVTKTYFYDKIRKQSNKESLAVITAVQWMIYCPPDLTNKLEFMDFIHFLFLQYKVVISRMVAITKVHYGTRQPGYKSWILQVSALRLPQLSHLSNGDENIIYFIGLLWDNI